MVGSGSPYSEFLPKEGSARGVQIDIKADMLTLRYPMEVPLVGDAAETLRLLQPKVDGAWRERIAGCPAASRSGQWRPRPRSAPYGAEV